MNILLLNIDSKLPNLALEKIKLYHLAKGDKIEYTEIFENWADKIYISCIFTFNRYKVEQYKNNKRAIIGGSGWDCNVKLPPEIDEIIPKINYGFTTRGCIRNCYFCFVPKMEGKIRIVCNDIKKIWDGVSKKITLLDNNILAVPEHFRNICGQIRDNNLKVDFNQGLDLRILYANKSLLNELQTIRHEEYKFAWDLDDNTMIEKLKWLFDNLGKCTIYVYVDNNIITYDKMMFKLNTLRDIGHNAYLMLDVSLRNNKMFTKVREWSNCHRIFRAMSFDEFLNDFSKNKKNDVIEDDNKLF